MYPQIDANEFAAGDVASGFLENFADDRLFRRFAGLNVSAGLTQYTAAGGVFLDQQILTVTLMPSWRNSVSTSLANQISSNILL